MLLAVLPCGKLGELSASLACNGAPIEVGDVAECGDYALYLNYREEEVCYVGVTYKSLWEEFVYHSSEVKDEVARDAEAVLCKISEFIDVAVATAAPSVRRDTEAMVYSGPTYWAWIRRGVKLSENVAKKLYPIVIRDIVKSLDGFATTAEVEEAFRRGEELCGGARIRLT